MQSAQDAASPDSDPAQSGWGSRSSERTAGSGVRAAGPSGHAPESGTRGETGFATGRNDAGPAHPPPSGGPAETDVRSRPALEPHAQAHTAAHSRRTLLSGVAIAGTLAMTGCGRRETPRPHPDVGVLTAVIASEEGLVSLYEAVRRAHGGLAARVDPALAHHREHLNALRRHYRPGTSPGTTTGGTTASRKPSPPPDVPGDEDAAIAALRAAERAAARARTTEAGQVSPALAQLLASIGACEAGHDATLARST